MDSEEKLKLNEVFALAVGWKRRGRLWIDPLGNRQALPPPYFQNEALAWGGMARNKSLGYRIEFFPETAVYRVVVWTDSSPALFECSSLATAICAAVATLHGLWQPAAAEEVGNADL